jgi:hypothetical protein
LLAPDANFLALDLRIRPNRRDARWHALCGSLPAMEDGRLKATFADGYLRATELSEAEVELRRKRFRDIERSVTAARAALIEAAVEAGLLSADQAAEMNRVHQARLREVERQLREFQGHVVRQPSLSM